MEIAKLKKWLRPALVALPRKRTMLTAFLLVAAVLLVVIPLFVRWMYPLKYEEQIFYSSEVNGADPFLVMAIIRVESKFDPNKRSVKGAEGLMQLMPSTVDWAIQHGKFPPTFRENVKDPAINIHIGTWWIAGLTREFKGNKVAAVAAYNAGPGNVQKWLKQGRWDGTQAHVRQIPYGETRHYIQRVMFFYEKYKTIYGPLAPE
jgi:soluble lytic murein transglycosylase